MSKSVAVRNGPFADFSQGAVPGLIWAFRIHHDGVAEPLAINKPIDLDREGLIWLHFNLVDHRVMSWLDEHPLDVPPAALALFRAHDGYQQIHTARDCVYGILSDLTLAIDQPTEDSAPLHFIMTDRLVISGRHSPLCSMERTQQALKGGFRIGSAAQLFEAMVEHIADAIDQLSNRLSVSLDEIEERATSDDHADLRKGLTTLRRTCVRLHRQLSGLRVIFLRLERDGTEALNPALRLRAGKLAQRLDDLDHAIVAMRERSRLLQEELHLNLEAQSNASLRTLSIMTAFMMPPTLITGVFGMNTKGLPLTDVESGFLWAMLLLAASAGLAYFVMKRTGIIR